MSKFLYPYPSKIELSQHKLKDPLISFYGLPNKVVFCKTCVISNQRPSSDFEHKNDGKGRKKTIGFNKDNICDACIACNNKLSINWKDREEKLGYFATNIEEKMVDMTV